MSLRTYSLITHPAYLRFVELRKKPSSFEAVNVSQLPRVLPTIKARLDIASYLGVDPLMIRSLVVRKEKHYRTFDIRKRSGGMRTIHAPRTFMKVAQWWILDSILSCMDESPHAFGFSKGRGFIENALSHQGAKHILNIDVKDFFPSVCMAGVYEVFSSAGYNLDVATYLAEICTFEGSLPQGAPTSPKISSLFLRGVDEQIAQIAARIGGKYTRYADDITISSDNLIPSELIGEISRIISIKGLKLNEKKTKFMGVNQIKEVTGLVLGKDGPALSPRYVNGTRGWFHTLSELPEFHLDQLDRLKGTLNLIRQVGGRGSTMLLKKGELALAALNAVAPPKLEWGD